MVGLTYSVDRTSSAPNALMVALYKADGEVFDLPVFSREAGVESLLLDAPPGDYYLEAVGVFCDWTVAVNEAK